MNTSLAHCVRSVKSKCKTLTSQLSPKVSAKGYAARHHDARPIVNDGTPSCRRAKSPVMTSDAQEYFVDLVL